MSNNYYYYYYYAAFNAQCVGHKDDESQAQTMLYIKLLRCASVTKLNKKYRSAVQRSMILYSEYTHCITCHVITDQLQLRNKSIKR